MMKKISILLTSLLALVLLAACGSAKEASTDWLEGEWHSTEWDVTYDFDEEDDKWSIQAGDEVVAKNASLTIEGDVFTLTDKDGTEYIVEKQSDTEIRYHQAATEGKLGTTAVVTFEKVDD